MTIRRKTFIIMGLTLVSLLVTLFAISSRVLLNGFAQIELKNAVDDAQRVRGALDETLVKLNGTASDWANWDDTYRYVVDRNPSYQRANLRATSVSVLNVNVMMLIGNSGEIVYGRGFDKSKGALTSLPPDLLPHLRKNRLLMRPPAKDGATSGILMLQGGPMLIVSRPILTSEKKGPPHGTLVMGRQLDVHELQRLSVLTRFSLDLRPYGEGPLPDDFDQARESLSKKSPVAIRAIDDDTIGAYILLDDIYRQPVLILRLVSPRDIYKQGLKSLMYLFGALVIVCLGICWVTLFLLQKLVLVRMEMLSEEVRLITADRDTPHRISSFGSDEVGMLAAAVNGLLAAEEQAYQQSQASENRFRAFMDNSPTVAYMKDAEGHYLYVNTTFQHAFGKTASQILGHTDSELWPGEIGKMLRENDVAVLQSNSVQQLEEMVPTTKVQETCWLSFKFPFRDASGEQVLAGVSMDITSRKAVERMKSEFVSTVSHELRTPLTAIRGALGIIIGVSSDVSDQTKNLLSLAHKNTERLGRLINDILDIEAIETGKMMVSIQPWEIMPIIENALELNSPYSNEFGVTFRIEQALPEAQVYADRDRLTQVLTNLLANAAKFSPRGESVEVNVCRLENSAAKSQIRVAITNRGASIPAEFHSRIFEKFAQADSSDTRLKGGTGLGLNISKAIIERFGGTIDFTSADGVTTFYFDLPEYRARVKPGAVEEALTAESSV